MKQMKKKYLFKWIYILPLILTLLFLVVLPLIYVVCMSFMQKGAFGGVKHSFSLNAYHSLWNVMYLRAVGKAVWLALKSTVICILLGYPFAYIVGRTFKKHGKTIIFLVMIPGYTSSLARLYTLVIALNKSGLLNGLLLKLGFIDQPLQMLYTDPSIILGIVQYILPFAIMPLYSSIEKLDGALLEASYDLGAGKVRTFFNVTLKLTSSGIFAAVLLLFIPALGSYFVTDIIGGGTVYLIGNIVNNQFTSAKNWPLGAALSTCVVAVVLIALYIYSKRGNMDDLGGM